jgi:hypothetical protein
MTNLDIRTHGDSLAASAAPCDGASARDSERQFFFDPHVFEKLRDAWKLAASKKALTKESLAAWAIIRGADPKRGFSPIVNHAKLANGAAPWAAYDDAMRSCARLSDTALEPWADTLKADGCILERWKWSGGHPLLALLAKTAASA